MQIKSKTQHHESQKFHYHIVEYAFLIQNIQTLFETPSILSELQPIKVW